jgi:serine phosphatase RsbU (regulator of sigma subunit)
LLLEISVSKSDKYGVSPGGDTVEITERPNGGVSVVMSDGQGSGAPGKAISSLVASKAITLIADGARDGAVARAVHDALYARRRGQVSATLTMVSADTDQEELVISRNSNCPVLLFEGEGEQALFDDETIPIGTRRMIKPHIVQLPLKVPRTVLAFTDGVLAAGRGSGKPVTIEELTGFGASIAQLPAADISRRLLDWALEKDEGRPADDISVVALRILPLDEGPAVREMSVRYPL